MSAEGFEGVHGRNGIVKRNALERRLLQFCDEKKTVHGKPMIL